MKIANQLTQLFTCSVSLTLSHSSRLRISDDRLKMFILCSMARCFVSNVVDAVTVNSKLGRKLTTQRIMNTSQTSFLHKQFYYIMLYNNLVCTVVISLVVC